LTNFIVSAGVVCRARTDSCFAFSAADRILSFTIGSIGDSGVGGKAMIITVDSNNVAIQSKSISSVRVETTVNLADHVGVAGGADGETSLIKVPVKTISEN
jgi:hypothetical protein